MIITHFSAEVKILRPFYTYLNTRIIHQINCVNTTAQNSVSEWKK